LISIFTTLNESYEIRSLHLHLYQCCPTYLSHVANGCLNVANDFFSEFFKTRWFLVNLQFNWHFHTHTYTLSEREKERERDIDTHARTHLVAHILSISYTHTHTFTLSPLSLSLSLSLSISISLSIYLSLSLTHAHIFLYLLLELIFHANWFKTSETKRENECPLVLRSNVSNRTRGLISPTF